MATKNELILAFNSFNAAADPKHDGSFEMLCSNFNSLNNELKVRGEPPKTIDTLKATFFERNPHRKNLMSSCQGLDCCDTIHDRRGFVQGLVCLCGWAVCWLDDSSSM